MYGNFHLLGKKMTLSIKERTPLQTQTGGGFRLPRPAGGNNSECLIAHRLTRSDPHLRLYRVLREAGDEIERIYQREFEEMSRQMIFSPNAAQRSFLTVAEELFRDEVNWGRIVAFFEFGGTMCVESVNREMASQVDSIAHWMTDYLNGPLENWIEENGGWVSLWSNDRDLCAVIHYFISAAEANIITTQSF